PDTGLGARPCARGFDAGVSKSCCRRKRHLGRGGGTGRPWQGATVGRRRNNSVTILGLFLRLPDESIDLTPWNHWRLPHVVDADADAGPVLVTVEYHVKPERVPEFIKTMRQYGRIRRRDGASRWGICRDLEIPNRYLETFVVSSWAEHLRQ